MSRLADQPFLMFVVSFIALCACAWFGALVLSKYAAPAREVREDLRTILAACLTLLGLIVGFSFSMAVSRYDLRKGYEAAEATAIGTEYARADLLPPADGQKIRQLLSTYLTQRLRFFTNRDPERAQQIDEQTTALQGQLWSAVQSPAATQPNPITALVVSGMNAVINSQGDTQAAWWNRIPSEAWALMGVIAVLCNVMLGFSAGELKWGGTLIVLPLVTAIAFFLIADIDSPAGGGLIHVTPHNLLRLVKLLH
ncbi:MAG TPA: hypothetical protein VKB72_07270 [Steroidobacteraceae bacterium]|nr:hypothetical protein [Steroidobacteraceae bacterium]